MAGILDYQIGFDVDAADAGDAYMTFDGTDIYFDESDQASMQVRKTGFLLAPEVNVAYQPDDGIIGVVMRDIQYLDHYIDTDAPWGASVQRKQRYELKREQLRISRGKLRR